LQDGDAPGFPKEVPLEVRVGVTDKLGKPRGELVVHGFAGEDSRLFAQAIEIPRPRKAGEDAMEDGPEGPEVAVESLQNATQDRFYDFLDSLGVDDKMSNYIKQHVWASRLTSEIDALKGVKSILGGK